MKVLRVRVQVQIGGASVDEVTGVIKIPRKFSKGQTPAVVLANGAGGGVDDPFLSFVQSYLVGRGFLTMGFNFPYREKGRKAPDRDPLLEATVLGAIGFLRDHELYAPGTLFVGGRSMGGRMSSHLVAADKDLAAGLLLLAYPLHAPGRPDRVRDKHLPDISVPTLFVSGTRDALAPLDSLKAAVKKVPQAQLVVVQGADHSFAMLRKSGVSADDVAQEVAEAAATWLEAVLSARAARPNAALAAPQAASIIGVESKEIRLG